MTVSGHDLSSGSTAADGEASGFVGAAGLIRTVVFRVQYFWRQWKRPSTRLRKLRALGISQDDAYVAYNRRGPWRNAALPQLTHALSPDYFRQLGLFGLVDGLQALRITSTMEPPCYGPVWPVV